MFDICISGTFYKHEIVYINQSEGERVWGEGGGLVEHSLTQSMNLNESYTCNLYKYFYTYLEVENMNKLFAKLDVFILTKSEYTLSREDVGIMIMEELYVNNFLRMPIIISYSDSLTVY